VHLEPNLKLIIEQAVKSQSKKIGMFAYYFLYSNMSNIHSDYIDKISQYKLIENTLFLGDNLAFTLSTDPKSKQNTNTKFTVFIIGIGPHRKKFGKESLPVNMFI
jgi:hypothetical protein